MSNDIQIWTQGDYLISTDTARLNLDVIYTFLTTESYWALGRPREMIARSIANSLPFGVYHEPTDTQIGFARVVTDRATFAWLADVFILPPHRGQGLSKWLVECVLAHPDLQDLRRFILATRDAHTLYERYGFAPLEYPDRYRERFQETFHDNPNR